MAEDQGWRDVLCLEAAETENESWQEGLSALVRLVARQAAREHVRKLRNTNELER
ncbi:hypothetical protein [Sphingomonas sp. Ag1]|jgi:hypothetical protein|uniref:hypothetical protein n=1 Tax=Sphingomonas sp. Ag1 TaxID=1642949 RepID=UPI000B14E8E0|nr:hypothetical protein [Sphingomonas sp. Ag1]